MEEKTWNIIFCANLIIAISALIIIVGYCLFTAACETIKDNRAENYCEARGEKFSTSNQYNMRSCVNIENATFKLVPLEVYNG